MIWQKFRQFIEHEALLSQGQTVLVAASGGLDSTVLADLLHRSGYRFALAHCDFSLRGEESDNDAQFVGLLADKYGCRLFVKKFDTEKEAVKQKVSIQMAARELRYNWFEEVRSSQGFNAVATGHHLDDQVETFLINLLRGTGIAGLHGIPVRQDHVIRPLLFATRDEIEAYAREQGLTFREDSSNSELKYLRNRVRREVIPVLKSINPAFTRGLSETIGRLATFEKAGLSALQAWRKELIGDAEDEWSVAIESLISTPSPQLYLWTLLSPYGFNDTQIHDLLSGLPMTVAPRQFITPTHILEIRQNQLVLQRNQPIKNGKPFTIPSFRHKKTIRKPLSLCFTIGKADAGFEIPASPLMAALDVDKLNFPLTLRHWEKGDAFYPLGMRQRKKVSDFFIDEKFSRVMKRDTWLLCSGNKIVWIVGHRLDHRFRITHKTQRILTIVPC